jgi:hypothetical protein
MAALTMIVPAATASRPTTIAIATARLAAANTCPAEDRSATKPTSNSATMADVLGT